MRSAPTLKIWITPLASVAMLEKFALLKIALCNAPALSSASSACLPDADSPRLSTPNAAVFARICLSAIRQPVPYNGTRIGK